MIVQKSLREGFGLTVSEGLWKGRPVIGGRAGGGPLAGRCTTRKAIAIAIDANYMFTIRQSVANAAPAPIAVRP